MAKDTRSRNFRVLLYPDCPDHVEALKLLQTYPKFSYILHDCDLMDDGTEKKPHWHCVLKFNNAKWVQALAKELGIEPNYVQPSHNVTHDLRYLVHADDPDKFQYDRSDVSTNAPVDLEKALQDVNEEDKVLSILDLLNSVEGYISTQAFLRMICAGGLYADFRRSSYVFLKCLDEHNHGDAIARWWLENALSAEMEGKS